jgi:hypothetical protein
LSIVTLRGCCGFADASSRDEKGFFYSSATVGPHCTNLLLDCCTDVHPSRREMKAADGSVLTLTKAEEAQQVASAASDMKASPAPAGPSISLAARSDVVEQIYFNEKAEMAYARQVELTNGRWGLEFWRLLRFCGMPACVAAAAV